MASGKGRNRRPVSTGDSKAVRELLGETPPKTGDDFDLPPGYETRREQDLRLRKAERRANGETKARATRAANKPAGATPPTAPMGPRGVRGGRGSAGASRSSGRSSSSGALGIRRAARSASVANPTGGRLPVGLTAGAGAAGLFFGAIAYALVLSVVDYGPSGPLLWFKAKFLNQAAGAAPSSSSSSSSSAPAPGSSSIAPVPQTFPGTKTKVPTTPPQPTPGRG